MDQLGTLPKMSGGGYTDEEKMTRCRVSGKKGGIEAGGGEKEEEKYFSENGKTRGGGGGGEVKIFQAAIDIRVFVVFVISKAFDTLCRALFVYVGNIKVRGRGGGIVCFLK